MYLLIRISRKIIKPPTECWWECIIPASTRRSHRGDGLIRREYRHPDLKASRQHKKLHHTLARIAWELWFCASDWEDGWWRDLFREDEQVSFRILLHHTQLQIRRNRISFSKSLSYFLFHHKHLLRSNIYLNCSRTWAFFCKDLWHKTSNWITVHHDGLIQQRKTMFAAIINSIDWREQLRCCLLFLGLLWRRVIVNKLLKKRLAKRETVCETKVIKWTENFYPKKIA